MNSPGAECGVVERTEPLDESVREALASVSTATLTTILFNKGLRNCFMRDVHPVRTGKRTMFMMATSPMPATTALA